MVFSLPACWPYPDPLVPENYYFDPKVVMDGSGNTVLVARRNKTGENTSVYVSHYTPGGEWEGFCCLNDISSAVTTDVAIAMDRSGSAIVVYHIRNARNRTNVYASRYVPGGPDNGWEARVPIDSNNPGGVFPIQHPKVAMDGSGNGVAVWLRDGNIYANYYTPGGGWEGPQIIGPSAAVSALSPDAAMFNDGSALAVWKKYDLATTTFRVYMNRYVPGSGWQTEEPVSSEVPSGEYDVNPRIATNPNTPTQMAVIVWVSGDNIYARRYVDGIPEDELLVGSGNIPGAAQDSGYHPTVAMDANGNAIAVWNGYDGTNYNVSASRYDVATGVWQTPEVIATGGITPLSPALAMDSAGNATALAELENVITAIRYIAGSGWQEPFAIETRDREEENPSIAMDDSGITIAAWDGKKEDSDALIIYTRVWEVWGTPIASFSYSPNPPNVGDTVDFGDGTPPVSGDETAAMVVTHTYAAEGDYTVMLRVTDNDGLTDESTNTVSVTGVDTPTACFTRTPIPAIIHQPIDFNAFCSTGTVVDYEWDFDYDGTFSPDLTATGAIVSSTYGLEGVYTVMLRVTNDSSMTDETTQTVTVGGGGPYSLTVNPTLGTATGVVYSEPPGISCGTYDGTLYTDCTESYASGDTVALMTQPSTGAVLTQWGTGDCDDVYVGQCILTMNRDRSVMAHFDFP